MQLLTIIVGTLTILAGVIAISNILLITAVSYTHLDVYKRQAFTVFIIIRKYVNLQFRSISQPKISLVDIVKSNPAADGLKTLFE